MKLTTIAIIAAIILAGCATAPHPVTSSSILDTSSLVTPAVSTPIAADTPAPPVIPEVQSLDPLVRALTSPTFIDHANRSLAIAGTSDPIFTNCVNFGIQIGQELQAKPLLQPLPSLAPLAIAQADPTCPLCVLAAKRKDIDALQSGSALTRLAALNERIAEVKLRARDIRKRTAVACAPLLVDEEASWVRLMAIFTGLAK